MRLLLFAVNFKPKWVSVANIVFVVFEIVCDVKQIDLGDSQNDTIWSLFIQLNQLSKHQLPYNQNIEFAKVGSVQKETKRWLRCQFQPKRKSNQLNDLPV